LEKRREGKAWEVQLLGNRKKWKKKSLNKQISDGRSKAQPKAGRGEVTKITIGGVVKLNEKGKEGD